jgi:hypothetical protein
VKELETVEAERTETAQRQAREYVVLEEKWTDELEKENERYDGGLRVEGIPSSVLLAWKELEAKVPKILTDLENELTGLTRQLESLNSVKFVASDSSEEHLASVAALREHVEFWKKALEQEPVVAEAELRTELERRRKEVDGEMLAHSAMLEDEKQILEMDIEKNQARESQMNLNPNDFLESFSQNQENFRRFLEERRIRLEERKAALLDEIERLSLEVQHGRRFTKGFPMGDFDRHKRRRTSEYAKELSDLEKKREDLKENMTRLLKVAKVKRDCAKKLFQKRGPRPEEESVLKILEERFEQKSQELMLRVRDLIVLKEKVQTREKFYNSRFGVSPAVGVMVGDAMIERSGAVSGQANLPPLEME